MTGARFVRTGRCRFFAGLILGILCIGMVAIFHSSQQELDEVRHSVLQCEQNMEALKKRWQATMEQKIEIEKTQKEEKSEHLARKLNLEQRLKDQSEQHAKELMEARVNLEKLQQTHKLLQSDHELLVNECAKSKKQQLDDANSLEKKLQSLKSELQKAKSLQESEVVLWKQKYDAAAKENARLEALLNVADVAGEQTRRMRQLQDALAEYGAHCTYKPKSLGSDSMQQQQQINKPLSPPETTLNAKLGPPLQMPSFDKPQSEKFFKELESVSPGLYHIPIKMVNRTQNANNSIISGDLLNTFSIKTYELKKSMNNANAEPIVGDGDGNDGVGAIERMQKLPFSAQNNRSLIINSVENFQIVPKPLQKISNEVLETQLKQRPEVAVERKVAPLSAPRKLTSTQSTKSSKSEQRVLEADSHRNATFSTSSSSSILPPLPMPPNQRKQIPDMVAPIPELDQLLKNDMPVGANDKQSQKLQQKAAVKNALNSGGGGIADIDAALEDTQRQENDDGTNNRYANVVNDMEHKSAQKKSAKIAAAHVENDSGAHEIKDQDLANEPNFNLPIEDDDNKFFDNGFKRVADRAAADAEADKHKDDIDNEDDDLGMGGVINAGDIAVKNQHLLEGDSLNNEVAGDQGKEFPDGLRIEDANEEDEDEDEYANLAARQQGAQAIRN